MYLAWTHWLDAHRGHVTDRAGSIAHTRNLFEEIKAVGVESANAKYLEAALFLIERRYDEALETATAAVRLGPCKLFGYAPAAKIQICCGDAQSALDLCRSSMRLSPFCPIDVLYFLAYALTWLGDHENAIQAAKEYGRRNPGDIYAYTLQSIVFDFAGDNESSRSAIKTLRELFPTFTLKDFVSHELYRDSRNTDRVVAALRKAGLPE